MITKNLKYNILTVGLLSLGGLLTFSGCTDDSLSSDKSDSRRISFRVSTSSLATRSDSERKSLNPITLSGGDDPLYLLPTITESSDNNSSPTRSSQVNSENILSFGVFAGYASDATSSSYLPNYMANEEITRSSGWTTKEEYFWPGAGALHINAYSPFFSSSDNGIISVNNEPGKLTLSYETPASVENMEDILYATPINASSSPCDLTFNHALTAIRFVTGSKFSPCTIKSIKISGARSQGSLNLESGEWTLTDKTADFTVSPNITLSASGGSSFVASDTPIATDSLTFLLLPQTLGEEAKIEIVTECNSKETTLSSSLTNVIWNEGKTITYHLSTSSDQLILDVTGDFNTPYTGTTREFNVKSYMTKGGDSIPVRWKAEFIDENDQPVATPSWIEDFTSEAKGDTLGAYTSTVNKMIFEDISPESKELQDAPDINARSGISPYNLSNSTGASTIENTANTYVINAPGRYMLPLVYGNAIKNGVANTEAYTLSSHSRNTKLLKDFINHKGEAITSPYINQNSGCMPKDAVMICEDELYVVQNITLSEDKDFIIFDIPQSTIRQANAIVAVRDEDDNVMWSWQIWVTNYNPDNGYKTVSTSGGTSYIASAVLGFIGGGDKVLFTEASANVKFTQIDLPDDVEPMTVTVRLTQEAKETLTPDCAPYYQWGRKDPMMSSANQWYNADHQEIENLPTSTVATDGDPDLIEKFIEHPQTFFMAQHVSSKEISLPYYNLWNVTQNDKNVKSIYDPSPVGYVVPFKEPLQTLFMASYPISFVASSSASQKAGFYFTDEAGETFFFPNMGYRSSTTGNNAGGEMCLCWSSYSNPKAQLAMSAQLQVLSGTTSAHWPVSDHVFLGMTVCPVKE